MKNMLPQVLVRNGLSTTYYSKNQLSRRPRKLLPRPSSHSEESAITVMSKVVEKQPKFPKFSETVKGKLSLGAKILQMGGLGRVFKRIFAVREGEKLLKTYQCYLSTTAGPIAGLLFISTHTVAFCSDRSIVKVHSPTGELIRFHYKVVIPVRNIRRANQSENVKKPSQKYLQVVTNDDYEFWFMGFLNYKRTFKCLQQVVSQM